MSSRLATGGTVVFALEHRPGHDVHIWRVQDLSRRPGRPPTEEERLAEAGKGRGRPSY